MKRVIYVILVLLVVLGLGKACIRADIDEIQKPVLRPKTNTIEESYPIEQNVTINGVDYLQSQAPIGKHRISIIPNV